MARSVNLAGYKIRLSVSFATTLVVAIVAVATPEILAPFTPLELKKRGAVCSSIIRLADGAVMTAEGNSSVVSRDGGATWDARRAILTRARQMSCTQHPKPRASRAGRRRRAKIVAKTGGASSGIGGTVEFVASGGCG